MIVGAWYASFNNFLNRENSLYKKLSFPIQYSFLDSVFLSVGEHLVHLVALCLDATHGLQIFSDGA